MILQSSSLATTPRWPSSILEWPWNPSWWWLCDIVFIKIGRRSDGVISCLPTRGSPSFSAHPTSTTTTTTTTIATTLSSSFPVTSFYTPQTHSQQLGTFDWVPTDWNENVRQLMSSFWCCGHSLACKHTYIHTYIHFLISFFRHPSFQYFFKKLFLLSFCRSCKTSFSLFFFFLLILFDFLFKRQIFITKVILVEGKQSYYLTHYWLVGGISRFILFLIILTRNRHWSLNSFATRTQSSTLAPYSFKFFLLLSFLFISSFF